MTPNRHRRVIARPFAVLTQSIAVLAAASVLAPASHAADIYWDGVSAIWNATANWSTDPNAVTPDPAAVPGINDLAIFNITGVNAAEIVSLNAAHSALGLVFNNTGTTTLEGSGANRTLTLGASGIQLAATAGAVTIGSGTANQNVTVALGAAQSWTNNSASLLTITNNVTNAANLLTITGSGNTTIAGVIGNGAGGITKTGNGTLTLTGANTYTGVNLISAGIVRATAAGSLGTGAATVNLNGGTLQLANNAGTNFGRNTTVSATSTIVSDRTTSAGTSGTHTLGTLSIGAQTLNVTRGSLITGTATGGITFGATTMTGNAIFAPGGNAQLNLGTVTGAFTLTKEGTGALRLDGANTFPTLALTNGTLILNNAAAYGNIGATIDVPGNAAIVSGNGVTLLVNDNITTGTGKTVNLISAGTVATQNRTSLGGQNNAVWNGNVVISGTSSSGLFSNAGNFTINGNVSGASGVGGAVFFRGNGTGFMNGNINLPSNSFFKTDGGTWQLNSSGHTYITQTQIADGVGRLGINDAFVTTLPLVIGQGSGTQGRFELNGFSQTVSGLRTDPGTTVGTHWIRNSNLNTAGTLTVNTAGTDNYRGDVGHASAGNFSLTKTGVGRLNLQDSNVQLNQINVNDGTLGLNITGTNARHLRTTVTGLAAGTIEKFGPGEAIVTGAFNHAGATTITAGRLTLGGGTAGAISVADGAALGAGFNGGSLNANSVSFGTAGATSFAPVLSAPGGTVAVSATNLTVNGTGVAVTPLGANITTGVYPLIGYGGGAINGGGFAAFAMGAPGTYPHITASLVNNLALQRVELDVTAVDSLVWTGASGVWDVNATTNFKLASDNSPANFFQGDRVLFDDTGTTKAITTTGAPVIGNLTFNNTTGNDYTVTGVLTGPGGISKLNTGTVTLASANTFTGPINVADGVLVLSGANTGTGAVSVTGGTLRLGNGEALSTAASVTIAPGGTLDVNGTTPGTKIPEIHVSGSGVGGNGAIVNNGAGITNNNHALVITLDGDTTWGGSGRYDINNTLINGGTFNLTKKGAAELAYQPAAGSTLGNVIVDAGTFTAQTANPLATTSSVIVNSGAIHQLFSTIAVQHSAVLNDGGILRSSNGSPVFNGTVTLNGTTTGRNIQATNTTTLNIAGQITGTGGFTMNDAGTVQIRNATNNYAGDTQISAGTLNFDTVGRLPVTTDLSLSGGTLDPVNRTHTVASLSGTGGQINQGTVGTGVIVTTQSTATTFSGNVNRVTIQMDGTGTLTLAGTTDNSTGLAVANNGTLVLAKTGDYGVHTIGSANLGLTINSGGTVQLGGNLTAFTAGTGSNTPPADITVATPPANYVDQIFNFTEVLVNSGGTFDLNGRMEAIDGIAGGGIITNSSATAGRLYVGYNNTTSTTPGFTGNTSTFSGTLTDGAGAVELRKIGTGTLVLSGANSHTGGTFVTAGTLVVNGGIAGGPVTVNGGTLAGSGETGALTLTSGILSPSDVLNPLDTGSLSLGGGSLAIDITGATASDQINVLGGVNFSANVALTLNFSTYDPVNNVDTFTLILNDGADLVGLSGGFTFGGNPIGEGAIFTATSGAFSQAFQITYAGGSGNDVVLTAVPEPTSAALLMGGLASVIGMRRTRRRR
jgi:fibronectin-binding autotransporter adhesin